jgi:putative PIN family toxin of toxin-antitoxin system
MNRPILVVDTNVIVSAMISSGGAAREVLRRCIRGQYEPVLGTTLFLEYEDLLERGVVQQRSPISEADRRIVIEAFVGACRWVRVYLAWRPNLRDEADNHLIELAVAAQADALVTHNLSDLVGGELKFPGLRILTPAQCLEVFPCPP